jgi:hypothetical protein
MTESPSSTRYSCCIRAFSCGSLLLFRLAAIFQDRRRGSSRRRPPQRPPGRACRDSARNQRPCCAAVGRHGSRPNGNAQNQQWGEANGNYTARGQPEHPTELPTNCATNCPSSANCANCANSASPSGASPSPHCATNCPRRVEHHGRPAFPPCLLPRTRQKPRRGWLRAVPRQAGRPRGCRPSGCSFAALGAAEPSSIEMPTAPAGTIPDRIFRYF